MTYNKSPQMSMFTMFEHQYASLAAVPVLKRSPTLQTAGGFRTALPNVTIVCLQPRRNVSVYTLRETLNDSNIGKKCKRRLKDLKRRAGRESTTITQPKRLDQRSHVAKIPKVIESINKSQHITPAEANKASLAQHQPNICERLEIALIFTYATCFALGNMIFAPSHTTQPYLITAKMY
ncbi:hypothetical protein CDEST_15591 [Colletotrichum destructivum]|uniref:Uncharacterized protein n=1 Tax=Colletotrichum destructivum TaxID=34406 RepID=A0AAX4J4P5_9PEZI|nr:hypothetical protein CDEST_15591 [Colletotrichum destructivum]